MAIKSFKNDGTADVAAGNNTKKARKVVSEKATKAAQRALDALATATDLSQLALPGYQLKDLKHTKPGFFSIRVNDQYRILFRFQNGEAHDVEIADYHAGYD